jgi:hypothetical protein
MADRLQRGLAVKGLDDADAGPRHPWPGSLSIVIDVITSVLGARLSSHFADGWVFEPAIVGPDSVEYWLKEGPHAGRQDGHPGFIVALRRMPPDERRYRGSMAQLANATACGISVVASSLGSYSTRGGTSAWAVRITRPSRSSLRSVSVSMRCEMPGMRCCGFAICINHLAVERLRLLSRRLSRSAGLAVPAQRCR